MTLDVVLDATELPQNQCLVLAPSLASTNATSRNVAPPARAQRVPRSVRAVVLERWTLQLQPPPLPGNVTGSVPPPTPSATSYSSGVEGTTTTTTTNSPSLTELPAVYKLAIVHFRAMFALMRTLPAYQLYLKLRATATSHDSDPRRASPPPSRRSASGGAQSGASPGLSLNCRMRVGSSDVGMDGEIGVEDKVPLAGAGEELGDDIVTETIRFSGVTTPVG